jgi:uncharacterized membrane-anchored protein YhcB (DUF1043 family)
MSIFEFAAFVAGVTVGALAARLLELLPRLTDLLDQLRRSFT